jgi:hypothetical protein
MFLVPSALYILYHAVAPSRILIIFYEYETLLTFLLITAKSHYFDQVVFYYNPIDFFQEFLIIFKCIMHVHLVS